MNIVRKINNELTIAGQITPEQLQQIADHGYKSVLNLRFPDENGWWKIEQEKTEFLGLCYSNLPCKLKEIDYQFALRLFQVISELPKPILIHCDNSMRSAAIALLFIANQQGMDFEKSLQKTIKFGIF
ncbi:beta-lactamase hydrolase domain-containing protein [Cylindrospermum sp. FACHB-282]|uniref:beta-lactamase hydrolase domain-containing protein n=1 Tax=Cylindrospermum sp. FACHB-282 TaxID=2692794 RepID=UPI001689E970|nr:sulfur transferase domain-containing protein [Cylindrospermum sp. FACHB-282]MBD2386075.1 hypothetical protein [Cylindrospermum sp. FACHB-282]